MLRRLASGPVPLVISGLVLVLLASHVVEEVVGGDPGGVGVTQISALFYPRHDPAPGALRGDLAGADLTGAGIAGLDLDGTQWPAENLRRTNLARASLVSADLRGADLREAVLSLAVLSRADLRNADLRRASLREAYLDAADLRGARLAGADLAGACVTWRTRLSASVQAGERGIRECPVVISPG